MSAPITAYYKWWNPSQRRHAPVVSKLEEARRKHAQSLANQNVPGDSYGDPALSHLINQRRRQK